MKLGTIAAGVGAATTITQQFVPQFLYWNNATVLQSIRVTINVDGNIVNLDSAGINQMRALFQIGRVANGYFLQLADGEILNKTMVIQATNGVAAAIDVYGFSFRKSGIVYMRNLIQSCIANSGILFTKFAFLGIPNAVTATDIITVNFNDGLTIQMDAVEAQAVMSFSQSDTGATSVGFDNRAKKIESIRFTPALAQNVYVRDYVMAANTSSIIS
jgi:hypothetical protein